MLGSAWRCRDVTETDAGASTALHLVASSTTYSLEDESALPDSSFKMEGGSEVELIIERRAGLDIGKARWSCAFEYRRLQGAERSSELRTFLTITSGLEELADGLAANAGKQVAMETTGQSCGVVRARGPPIRSEFRQREAPVV